jgi:hypothetical protein
MSYVNRIFSLRGIIEKANYLIEQAQSNYDPSKDELVIIDTRSNVPNGNLVNDDKLQNTKNVIAGSKAVATLLELLRTEQKKAIVDGVKGCGPYLKLAEHFKPDDTDIFFLDCKEISRLKYENVDIIHLKVSTVTDLLNTFDLNCCKTAMNMDKTIFWVSYQCLYTMLTGNCFLPKYLTSRELFQKIYTKSRRIYGTGFILFEQKCNATYLRYETRIGKYKDRGYTFQYIDTDKILPCILSNHMSAYNGEYGVHKNKTQIVTGKTGIHGTIGNAGVPVPTEQTVAPTLVITTKPETTVKNNVIPTVINTTKPETTVKNDVIPTDAVISDEIQKYLNTPENKILFNKILNACERNVNCGPEGVLPPKVPIVDVVDKKSETKIITLNQMIEQFYKEHPECKLG